MLNHTHLLFYQIIRQNTSHFYQNFLAAKCLAIWSKIPPDCVKNSFFDAFFDEMDKMLAFVSALQRANEKNTGRSNVRPEG